MISIYKITSPSYPDKCYIGSTQRTLKQRLKSHYDFFKSYIKNNKNMGEQSIFQLLNYNDAIIELLEECQSEQRFIREQFYINITNCINTRNALPTEEQRKQWHKKNDIKRKDKRREKLSSRILCIICDKELATSWYKDHFKMQHTEM